MILETYIPYLKSAFWLDTSTDEEVCASLTPSLCPEIITLLNLALSKDQIHLKKLNTPQDFDEYAQECF